ncbi:MAG: hypothetical protein IJT16_06980 [Lachnospiraceae bacterium]|nr:hypothetical protein [Lachnospiraceae bacterium]
MNKSRNWADTVVKRLGYIFLLICMIFSLSSCGKGEETGVSVEVPASTENDITAEKLGIDNNVITIIDNESVEEEETETPEESKTETNTVSGNEVSSVSENEIDYSSVSPKDVTFDEEGNIIEENKVKKTEDGKVIVDLVMFMGQSNMSGTGGNAAYAPTVPEGHGYEFRAVSDPTRLYPIREPFGINENNIGGIMDYAVAKKGSLVSAFANEYYKETGVPIVAVSASEGGTDTDFWLRQSTISDFSERQKRAQVWLESNNYYIRKQYVVWLQGESDALDNMTTEEYKQNMDNIIRPLFIGGVQKVYIITPGRMIESTNFYDPIINAQIELCKNSGYYALATTVLCAVSTEYMVDALHYNQSVLNLVGKEAAKSAAYYTLNTKEMCLYDYKNKRTYIPDGFDYDDDIHVEPLNVNEDCGLTRYE